MNEYLPVGFNPPVFDGAIPAKPNAAKPANGFLVKPLICAHKSNQEIKYKRKKEEKKQK